MLSFGTTAECQVVADLCALGLDDRGAPDVEEVGELGGAVFSGLEQLHQMGFLARVQLGLFAAEPALGLGLGDFHALASAQPDRQPWPRR